MLAAPDEEDEQESEQQDALAVGGEGLHGGEGAGDRAGCERFFGGGVMVIAGDDVLVEANRAECTDDKGGEGRPKYADARTVERERLPVLPCARDRGEHGGRGAKDGEGEAEQIELGLTQLSTNKVRFGRESTFNCVSPKSIKPAPMFSPTVLTFQPKPLCPASRSAL